MMRFQYKSTDWKSINRKIQSFFQEGQIEELANRVGFVQRRRNLTGANFLSLCVFGIFKEGLSMSLTQMSGFLFKLGSEMTNESLNARFNSHAVSFMKGLFETALLTFINKSTNLKLLEHFNGVHLQDSTSFQLPVVFQNKYPGSGGGASVAGLKIDLTFNLQNGTSQVILRGGNTNDLGQTSDKIEKGSLWLRDLGYLEFDSLRRIIEANASYISRLKSNILIFVSEHNDAEQIELAEMLDDMFDNEIREHNVFIGSKQRLAVRLIIQKVPQEIADQKRHKLKNDKQNKRKSISARRLKLCALNMMITNIPKSVMCAQNIMKVYQIRWQIELIFKIWKSQYQIHTIKAMKIERMECQLYGRLILILLNTMIMTSLKIQLWNQYGIDISESKAHQLLRDTNHMTWVKTINKRLRELNYTLELIFNIIVKYARKSYKKGTLSPLKIPLT